MKAKIKVDIVSDIVCPWCYIGKRRFEKAVKNLESEFEFEINYLPFELNPNVPKQGLNQKEYLVQKFGGEARYEQLTNNVSNVAAVEGLNFDYEKQTISPNTFQAHRVIWYSAKEGKQAEVTERFFKAFFEDGVDMTKDEHLTQLASEAGLNKEKLDNFLSSHEGGQEVRMLQAQMKQIGVSGVPFYIINNTYGISGAQPAEVLEEALRNIAGEIQGQQGEACDADGNCY